MNVAAVESWIEAPLRRYVDDARARLAVLLHPSGQVMAQAGFTRDVDVMAACALAAAAHATAGELGRQLDGNAFRGLHYAGASQQLFLSALETPRGTYVCLTVFDETSSLGLVRLYFDELCREMIAAAPVLTTPRRTPTLAADFETELNRNLAALFSGAKTAAVVS
jgi:predicted regulator of Ras-like GTPase activity (Roadblock/LC7/MglB family)